MSKSKSVRVRALRAIEANLRSQLDNDRRAAFNQYIQACARVNPRGTTRRCVDRFERMWLGPP